MGTIERSPGPKYGRMSGPPFSLKGSIPNPAYPGTPEAPEPPKIAVQFTRVVFQIEGSQEVMVDEVDYFLVHSDQILAFIPPE